MTLCHVAAIELVDSGITSKPRGLNTSRGMGSAELHDRFIVYILIISFVGKSIVNET